MASMAFALKSCDAEVLAFILSISDISLWLFPSITNRLNIVRYPSGSSLMSRYITSASMSSRRGSS